MAYDLQKIRSDFPILAEEIHGKRLVFLDSGASAQKPVQVLDRMNHLYLHEYANVHRGMYTLANRATDAYEKARETVRSFMNAETSDEIIFTKSSTEAINLVAQSFVSPMISEGDEIVLTIMEHHANIVPWHFLRERQGAVLKWVDVKDDGAFDMEAFEASLTERTKFIAVTHMSNVLGTIVPVKEIVERAHARGIAVLIDGSQGIVHTNVDVQDIGADFYTFTGHKLYGPTGVGVLHGKKEHLNIMRPFLGGGDMIDEVTLETVTYNKAPFRFEAGTPAIAECVGLGAAIDYINSIGRDEIHAHEVELTAYAAERFAALNQVHVIGNAEGKGGIFSFVVENAHAHDVATILDRYGVAVRAGTHCAMPLLKRFNATSTCRASLGLYNGKDDIDALIESIQKAQSFF